MSNDKTDKKDGLPRCQFYLRWPMSRNSHEVDKTHRQSGDDEKERSFEARRAFSLTREVVNYTDWARSGREALSAWGRWKEREEN